MQQTINVCDDCTKKSKQIAKAKCKICGKDLCEDCGIGKQLIFIDLDISGREDVVCEKCDKKIDDFNEKITDWIGEDAMEADDEDEKEDKAYAKELIKPFKRLTAKLKVQLWSIMKKSLMLENMKGDKKDAN